MLFPTMAEDFLFIRITKVNLWLEWKGMKLGIVLRLPAQPTELSGWEMTLWHETIKRLPLDQVRRSLPPTDVRSSSVGKLNEVVSSLLDRRGCFSEVEPFFESTISIFNLRMENVKTSSAFASLSIPAHIPSCLKVPRIWKLNFRSNAM